jgi:hypothetical protein
MQGGIDSEDIQPIPGRNHFAIVDEYNPSIAIVRGFPYGRTCGQGKHTDCMTQSAHQLFP